MSHITRRKFIAGTSAVIGTVALAPIIQILPVLPPVPVADPYAAFAEALVAPILAEIKEASVMRQIMSIKELKSSSSPMSL